MMEVGNGRSQDEEEEREINDREMKFAVKEGGFENIEAKQNIK